MLILITEQNWDWILILIQCRCNVPLLEHRMFSSQLLPRKFKIMCTAQSARIRPIYGWMEIACQSLEHQSGQGVYAVWEV